MNKPEKFFKIGLAKAPKGTKYTLTVDGAVLLHGENQPSTQGSLAAYIEGQQLVREFKNTQKEYLYFIDKDGDISREKKENAAGKSSS